MPHKAIFWRSKDKAAPPPDAQFSLWPFHGKRQSLDAFSIIPELPPPSLPIRVLTRTDNPNKAAWTELVNKALAQIQTGAIQKVVLARETTLTLGHAPDPLRVTAALYPKSEGAALFCVQFGKEKAFLGASPERLFRGIGEKIVVEAVAGTRKRGTSPEEDATLEQELLSSEKDLREFQFVQDYLQQMIPSLAFAAPTVHRTANVQHLFSQGMGRIQKSHRDVVELLHPTPALLGTPKQAALAWIQSQEPFQRGFYGGILGWEKGAESEWMVGIRCCMLEGSIAKIYVGLGIVKGSDPHLEWEELEAKMSLYKGVFR
jgi:menaquinone-specific isochorismate synthase